MSGTAGTAVRAVLAALLLSTVGAAGPPATPTRGIVVEEAIEGSEAARAGIRPGDLLVSWEREANPPSNPAPASGLFRTPFDVLEVFFEQVGRVEKLKLVLMRNGTEISVRIGQDPWRLQARPAFAEKRLSLYEEGWRRIDEGNVSEGLAIWRSLADALSESNRHVDAAWLWSRIGARLSSDKQPDSALVAIGRARDEAKAAKRTDIEAQLRGVETDVLRAAGRRADAQRAAREALALRKQLVPNGLAVGVALHELTTVLPDEAPEFESSSERALRIREKLAPGSRLEAESVANLARFAGGQGATRDSIELQRRALAIHRRLDPSGPSLARGLSTLCAYQMNGGDLVGADESCRQSIEAARSLGPASRALVGQALHNLGVVARLRGEFDRSVRLFQESLEIYDRLEPGGRMVAANYWDIAATEVSRRDVTRLDAAEENLRRSEKLRHDDPRGEALIALIRADIAHQRKDLDEAEKDLRRALPHFDRLAPGGAITADILGCLGVVLTEEGRFAEAEEVLRRALTSSERFAPASQKTAEFRHHLVVLLWRAGRLGEAEVAMRQSLDDLEFQVDRLSVSEEESSSFSAQYADFYKAYVDLLIELHREQDAFLILERYRAGAFLRALARRDLTVPDEVPAELNRERQQAGEEYERVQSRIRQLDRGTDAKRADEELTRLAEIRARQAEIAERIRKTSPRYATLRYPQPLDLAATISALDPGTILLSYAVGKERSVLFVACSSSGRGPSLSVFPLPIGGEALREAVSAYRRMIDRRKPLSDLVPQSRALYTALVAPAEPLVAKAERVLIVPDGPLHLLPWASLVRTGSADRPEFFVSGMPLGTVASATVYAELKKARPGGRRVSAIEVAAFGDPLYPAFALPKTDVRRGEGEESPDECWGDDLEVGAALRGGRRFEPLPRSRHEVETIASLYAPRAEAYLGAEATEQRAVSVGRGVPLIHYACHAYFNERFPLDSALVFTIPEKPQPGQDNGLLQAWEIIEKVRIDADLVTLSACDTGLGKELGGEGLIGLTRAFQYAGARSVLASLWKIDDAPTSDLMKRFYGHLKAGRTKAEALRLAQVEMLRSPSSAHPRDWAGFTLIGDWR